MKLGVGGWGRFENVGVSSVVTKCHMVENRAGASGGVVENGGRMLMPLLASLFQAIQKLL